MVSKIKPDTVKLKTSNTSIYNYHRIMVTSRRADLLKITSFRARLKENSPSRAIVFWKNFTLKYKSYVLEQLRNEINIK